MPTPDWTLYIKPRCPWCIEAVEYLRAHRYEFREINVSADGNAYKKMQTLSGQRLTPTLVIESTGQILPDFDVRQLETFLKKNDLLKKAA